jgi:putative inorganic carbon (HCO3(-)) transporter
MTASATQAAPAPTMSGWGWPAAWTVAFLATGLVGVWTAYDRPFAWYRFGLILVGILLGLCTARIGRKAGDPALAAVGLGCALLAAALAAYFLLAFDWQARGLVKIPVFYQAGLWLQGHRPAVPAPQEINTNAMGGALALLLPLAAGAVAWAWRRWSWPVLLLACAALGLGLVGLLLTVSRGAWVGLAAGAVLALYLFVRSRNRQGQRRRAAEYGLLVLLILLVAAVPFLAITGKVVAAPLSDASTRSRPELWRWGMGLVSDYPFTGSGLGSTMMVHATYVVMLHVGFIRHMHNLLLQIAVEQGIPGLIAFTALVVLAIASLTGAYRAGRVTPLFAGSVVALTALLVHGAVDTESYATPAVVLLFLPIGFALGLGGPRAVRARPRATQLAVSAGILLVLFLLLAPARAALLSNLGAVAQTRAELSQYRWPDVPIQDALRRSPGVDLAPAIEHYRAALAVDATDATANRRLGQIELARGQYEAARRYLEAAYASAPEQQATRQLLGESYAIAGDTSRAAALWAGLDLGEGQLTLRTWWYEHIGEPEKAQRIREVAKKLGL